MIELVAKLKLHDPSTCRQLFERDRRESKHSLFVVPRTFHETMQLSITKALSYEAGNESNEEIPNEDLRIAKTLNILDWI